MTRRHDTFSKKNTFIFFIFYVLIVQSDSKPTTFMLVIIKSKVIKFRRLVSLYQLLVCKKRDDGFGEAEYQFYSDE